MPYMSVLPLDSSVPHVNLALVNELLSLCPLTDARVLNLLPNSDTPQIFTACGHGARGTLCTLRHGLEVEEFRSADVWYHDNGLWTTKCTQEGVL